MFYEKRRPQMTSVPEKSSQMKNVVKRAVNLDASVTVFSHKYHELQRICKSETKFDMYEISKKESLPLPFLMKFSLGNISQFSVYTGIYYLHVFHFWLHYVRLSCFIFMIALSWISGLKEVCNKKFRTARPRPLEKRILCEKLCLRRIIIG